MIIGTTTMLLLSADSSATQGLRVCTVALTMDRVPDPSGSIFIVLGANPPYSIADSLRQAVLTWKTQA